MIHQQIQHGLLAISFAGALAVSASADWPQWRGPERLGFDPGSPHLRSSLPAEGLPPVWVSGTIVGGNSGGWSSPVVAGSRVFVYSHTKSKVGDVGPAKYPYLPPEKRTSMSDQEYREYEIKRRDEQEQRSKAYRFDETIYCIDMESGKTVWSKTTPSVYTRFVQSSTPAVHQDRLFILSAGRIARCLDIESGEELWRTLLPGEFRDQFWDSSFLVARGLAIISCGQLFALNVDDGSIVWQDDQPADRVQHSSPVLWQGGESTEPIVISNVPGGKTVGYRLADGAVVWTVDSGASHSTPVVIGQRLLTYGSSRKSGLRCYDLGGDSTPVESWKFQRAADPGSTPLVMGDHVYVQGERRIACVELATGRSRWQTTLEVSNPRYTSLVGGGDQAIYAWEGILVFSTNPASYETLYDARIDRNGRLNESSDLRKRLGIDQLESTNDGLAEAEKRWQREAIRTGPLKCATPALTGGRLVVRLADRVVCYDLRARGS